MPDTLPDALPDVKQWLKNLGLVGQRVFFRIPNKPSSAPFFRLSQSGGGPLFDAEVPLVELRLTVESYGMADSDYDAVRAAALGVEQAVHNIESPIAVGSTVFMWGNVVTSYDHPDPDSGWPRRIVMLTLGARAA